MRKEIRILHNTDSYSYYGSMGRVRAGGEGDLSRLYFYFLGFNDAFIDIA